MGTPWRSTMSPSPCTRARSSESSARTARARPRPWNASRASGRPIAARSACSGGKLSGGQKQRLSIALALLGSPQVAVLDELTTGLDPQARRDTWELIEGVRDRGVTIVLVTHFMEEAERLCDRVALIDAGHVVAIDTPAGLAGRVEG